MADRETIAKGLHDIGGFIAGRVGFEQAKNFMRTIDDAIDLLKEQEKPNDKCVNECECWDSAYERGKHDALKEQEPVKPVNVRWEMGINGGNCPKCMNWVQRSFNFCPFCGEAVKWE